MELLMGQGLILSYIDSNIPLNVFIEDKAISDLALSIITDPQRRLMVSDYVELETLPKMIYNKREKQVLFTMDIFNRAIYIHSNDAIVKRAHDLAKTYGLAGMDALHAASAIEGGADELLTFEKPTKPFFRIPESLLKVVSLHEVAGPETAGG